jgi:nicotinamide-nucleotide amidase
LHAARAAQRAAADVHRAGGAAARALGLLLDREAYVQIRTAGVGESALEHKLQPIFDRQGDALSVAYCAHAGQVDCRVSSPSGRLDDTQLQQIAAECALLLGEDFFAFGHDSLAKVCADLLRNGENKLAVIEAATGGLLVESFTNLCGAGKFFAGGCVCCCNEAKTQLLDVPEEIMLQHGAVSPETAVALASGAAEKLGADYALAITGFAGPCSGSPQENPVGTMYIALYSPQGVWSKNAQLSRSAHHGEAARGECGARLAAPRTAPRAKRGMPHRTRRLGVMQ